MNPDDNDTPNLCWLCGGYDPPASNTTPCAMCAEGMAHGIWVIVVHDDCGQKGLEASPPVFPAVGPTLLVPPESFENLVRGLMKPSEQEENIKKGMDRRYFFMPLSIAVVSGLMGAYFDEGTGPVPDPDEPVHKHTAKNLNRAAARKGNGLPTPSEN